MAANLAAKAERAAAEAEARAKSTLSNAHLEAGDSMWGAAAGRSRQRPAASTSPAL